MPLQPDIKEFLDTFAAMELPPIDSMDPASAREFVTAMGAERPPGPDVAEIVDGTFPGAAGDLEYRLYRPNTDGPLPIVVYYHGGGWVLGDTLSDDPFCRDLAVRAGALLVSCNYRHAPEHRFPAASDDALAAVRWVADNAAALGGDPGRIAVCGYSAGGNLAAVTSQRVRDEGGPSLAGQVMYVPVTDWNPDSPSLHENAEGYFLTAALMTWFWDHYTDEGDRLDPRVAPLRATDLSGLPPAFIMTCEFDPLRDEGEAYGQALSAAGVDTTVHRMDGHIHTSVAAVDVLPSGVEGRVALAEALRGFLGS
jgi:acetyl esterase/lipase